MRISPELQKQHVNPRGERNNHQACALFGHECCVADRMNIDGYSINQQPAKQKETLSEVITQNVIIFYINVYSNNSNNRIS